MGVKPNADEAPRTLRQWHAKHGGCRRQWHDVTIGVWHIHMCSCGEKMWVHTSVHHLGPDAPISPKEEK